ncbi:hypothetical protein GH714_006755 [Hevea brasiliensis]|uniref:60S ribosomal export protein NMD3 n=1 Tax=Hevea brasiliensis TaxID=3981 RepID=A0A6A6M8S9_HEVBR|nr:hypothetical protein GH714_006755 [Hevea brasiliensis]
MVPRKVRDDIQDNPTDVDDAPIDDQLDDAGVHIQPLATVIRGESKKIREDKSDNLSHFVEMAGVSLNEDELQEINAYFQIASAELRKLLRTPAMAESAMFVVPQTIGNILCCKCGILMVPNGANMCVTCLRSEIDITEGLRKRVIILHCPDCTSYLKPPSTWIEAQLESKELLKFCVDIQRNQHDKAKVRLVDAFFIWTEPHSKRIKVKLKIQKDVFNGTILEQSYVVEYVVQPHLCENCSRVQVNPDQWVAVVQLRQHVSHRRTFFFLEQLILKHGAAVLAIKIKQVDEGIDFFFAKRSYAMKFVEFIGKVVPLRTRYDRQLVSHDSKSNKYNYKYTFSVEICPICREDLICLPPKVASNLGNIGPL